MNDHLKRGGQQAAPPPLPTGVGTISGRVLGPDGGPVPGAAVTMPGDDDDGPPVATTTTDHLGVFSLPLRPTESFPVHRRSPMLWVEADGFAAAYVSDRHLTVFPGHDKRLDDIFLDRGRSYSGRVTDAAGVPVPGAAVTCGGRVHYLGQTVLPVGRDRRILTDAAGEFTTPPLPLAGPTVSAQADGLLRQWYTDAEFRAVGPAGRLPDLRLDADWPIRGTVVTDRGEPVSGARLTANGGAATTGPDGRFCLRGLAKGVEYQLHLDREGYTFINWMVRAVADGYEVFDLTHSGRLDGLAAAEYHAVRSELTRRTPDLVIRLEPEGSIHGVAVDAETGAPVTVTRVILCTCTRDAAGVLVPSGCADARFAQPEPGSFSVRYSSPAEYHLTVSADGFDDAEAFTPPLPRRERVDGVRVPMKRRAGGSVAPAVVHPLVTGEVVVGVDPVPVRVAVWRRPSPTNAINAYLVRGRVTAGDGVVFESQMATAGRFALELPYAGDDWYVIAETPRLVVAVHGPVRATKAEPVCLRLTVVAAGTVGGRVTNRGAVDGPLWAVLFSDVGLQYETPVGDDGRFAFRDVYPGEYGLKAGCDAVRDSEVPVLPAVWEPTEEQLALEALPSRPWGRAVRVTVGPGECVSGVAVAFEA